MAERRKASPSTPGKVVPKKPKTSKAAKPSTSTAIARVAPSTPSATIQLIRPAGLGKAFVQAAETLDQKIVSTYERLSKDVVALGEMFAEMQDKAYHTALGFPDFRSYLQARFPEKAPAGVFQAMRIVRELTQGPNPVATPQDIREMTAANAEGLAKLKKQGHTITRELIQEAKDLPIVRFQSEIVLARSPELTQRAAASQGTHLATIPAVTIRRVQAISSETEALRVQAVEVFRLVGKEDIEDTPSAQERFEDRFYQAVFAEFIATHGPEYAQIKAHLEAKTVLRAQTIAAKMGDGPQVIEGEIIEGDVDEADELAAGEADADVSQASEVGAQITQASPSNDFLYNAGERPQCSFIKPNLKRCTSPAVDDSKYCGFHKDKGERLDAEAQRDEANAEDQLLDELASNSEAEVGTILTEEQIRQMDEAGF